MKNPEVRAAFAINKHEPNELIAARKVIQDLRQYIVQKGHKLSDVHCIIQAQDDKYNEEAGLPRKGEFIDGGDDFGLPKFTRKDVFELPTFEKRAGVKNPFTDKMKEKSDGHVSIDAEGEVVKKTGNFGDKEKVVDVTKSNKYDTILGSSAEPVVRSWSQILKEPPLPTCDVKFEYFPL